MKRWALLCGALLLFSGMLAGTASAQTFEAFGGYSYFRFNPGDDANGANFNGGSGSLAFNATPWLGVVADFGGYHWGGSADEGITSANAVTYMFGPKVSYHAGPIVPFAQVLFGGIHGTINGPVCEDDARVHREGCDEENESFSENAFAMALGGGVDWNATEHLGVRLIQVEYVMTRFNTDFAASNSQNNVRISAGVTFRF